MLIDAGADACFKDDQGFSPLMVAAKLGHKEVACLLISKGADVEGSSTVAALREAMEAEEEDKRRAEAEKGELVGHDDQDSVADGLKTLLGSNTCQLFGTSSTRL